MLRLLLHIVLFCLLTILTQIGGIAYLLALLLVKKTKKKYRLKRGLLFVGLYLLITFLIVPTVAPFFGRQKIENNETITAHFYGTILLNRNYVSSELHQTLQEIAQQFHQENPNLKVMYLDANFPFFDGFPLLPHLSHSDGKKVDLSFVYNDPNENPSNKNPSNTGYGVFEDPQVGETNQTKACKNRGYWQYDFPKYLT
jgi:energy-coupling factor transporter transmembrane protein EcfT